WPLDAGRLSGYLEKATREAKRHTTWTEPDPAYDEAVRRFAEAVVSDEVLRAGVAAFVDRLAPTFRVNVLGQKLVQLTMPGIPDVYQGCDSVDLSLVDPDNRRPVDYADRRARLARLDRGEAPADLADEKLLVVSRALRLRREHPEWFGPLASYEPVPTSTPHALAFTRGGHVATVVTRLAHSLSRAGGWDGATITLPPGTWTDVLSGRSHAGGTGLAEMTDLLPAALLVRAD
ncbi:MAG: (1-_4)-alpha-D-glucan 1-alpha-D-glucosylmutase, partial [Actinomycetota bacterium]|nr:(1->4)-alpha-D-glucan 1-alpha-D-glucosylmutase [Actinomycetota bacterium]